MVATNCLWCGKTYDRTLPAHDERAKATRCPHCKQFTEWFLIPSEAELEAAFPPQKAKPVEVTR